MLSFMSSTQTIGWDGGEVKKREEGLQRETFFADSWVFLTLQFQKTAQKTWRMVVEFLKVDETVWNKFNFLRF